MGFQVQTSNDSLEGSRMRASTDSNGAEDYTVVDDSASPISSSFSFLSSDFSDENDIDISLDASGPSVTDTLPEVLPSSGAGVDSLPPTGFSTMASPFVCDRAGCSRSFAKRHELNRHIGWHDKPLNCPKNGCDYRTQFKKEIEKHVWSRHVKWAEETNRQPIRKKCKLCSAVLERPDNAKRHMDEVHKGIKRRRGPGG
ncbi:hypothetical protein V8C42DRAFT_25225 [Trichoderma barbatum]